VAPDAHPPAALATTRSVASTGAESDSLLPASETGAPGARQRRLQRDQTACSESREPASSKRRDYCSPAGGGVDVVAGAAAEFEESEHSDQAEPDCCIHEDGVMSPVGPADCPTSAPVPQPAEAAAPSSRLPGRRSGSGRPGQPVEADARIHAIAQLRENAGRSAPHCRFHSGTASRLRRCQLTPRDADGADARGLAAAHRPIQTSGSLRSRLLVRTNSGDVTFGLGVARISSLRQSRPA